MKRDPAKQVLYNVDWQILRVQLLDEYSEHGGFGTIKGVRENLKKLKKYLGDMKSINKVWRVLNLLNAVKFGYGRKDKGTDREKAVTKFQEKLSKIYKELKETQEFKPEPKEKVLKDIKKAPEKWIEAVQKNLTDRYENAKKPENRPELKDFLNLLKKGMKKKSFEVIVELRKLSQELFSK